MEIDLGHSAWQAPVLVQLPKPSSSILATIALARRAPSTRPCGSLASDDTRAATKSMAEPFLQVAEDGQTTKFYIRETALSAKSELVMITYGAKETVVVNIYGEFDLKQVARLSSIRPQ